MPRNAAAVHRRRLGLFGEWAAAAFLERRGVSILRRRLQAGKGEIDLVARDEAGVFAVEVKSGTASAGGHPRWNFSDEKAARVVRSARSLGIHRVDLVTVLAAEQGVEIEWHRRVA